MAQLFDVGISAISKHLKNIFDKGELQRSVLVSKMEITNRELVVFQKVKHYRFLKKTPIYSLLLRYTTNSTKKETQ